MASVDYIEAGHQGGRELISKSLQIASADIAELNNRLLEALADDTAGFAIPEDERAHYTKGSLVKIMAQRGMCLFVTRIGNTLREWEGDALQARFDYLLVARDLVISKDPIWAESCLGIQKDLAHDLTSATKLQLREMAQHSTPWETRFPAKIFEGITVSHDPKFIYARMMLAGR